MTVPNCSTKAKSLITTLVKAADKFAFLGSQPPQDHVGIRENLTSARQALVGYIGELEGASNLTQLATGVRQFVAALMTDDNVSRFMQTQICCSGQDCGCRGTSVGEYIEHLAVQDTPKLPEWGTSDKAQHYASMVADTNDADILRAAITDLCRDNERLAVRLRVKPLVWAPYDASTRSWNGPTGRLMHTRAMCAGLSYTLEREEDPTSEFYGKWFVMRGLSHKLAGPLPTDVDAKAWCQGDCEAHITAAQS